MFDRGKKKMRIVGDESLDDDCSEIFIEVEKTSFKGEGIFISL